MASTKQDIEKQVNMKEEEEQAKTTSDESPVLEELSGREKFIHKFLEFARIGLTIAALVVGGMGQYRLFAALFVIGMDGLLAFQVFFLYHLTRRAFKWTLGPFYRQSGCCFLSHSLCMIVLLAAKAPDAALASLTLTSGTFFLFSGVNHLGTELHNAKKENRAPVRIHYFRFLGAVPMVAVIYWIIFGQWKVLV